METNVRPRASMKYKAANQKHLIQENKREKQGRRKHRECDAHPGKIKRTFGHGHILRINTSTRYHV